jgi:hypothetical protein
MQTFETGLAFTSLDATDDDTEQPSLEVAGAEGTVLRATRYGLTICPGTATGSELRVGPRHWGYDQLGDVHIDAYGPVGVIRATIRASGTELPLLLLEPDQIPAARRTLEIVWNLMGAARFQGRLA